MGKQRDTQQMRVLLVSTSFPLNPDGSSGIFVKRLADELAKSVDLRVLVPDALDPSQSLGCQYPVSRFRYAPRTWQILAHEPGGIPVVLRRHRLAWLLVPLFLVGFLRAIWRSSQGISLIQANWAVTGLLCGLVGKVRGCPVVTTLRGADVAKLDRSRLDRWVTGQCLRLSCRIITVSKPMRAALIARWPEYEPKIQHVANGVHPSFLELPVADQRYPLRLITIGSLIERKRPYDVLRAVAELDTDSCFLTIVGDGPLRTELEQEAERLGLSCRVRFTGSVPPAQIASLISENQVFVLTSKSEGRPNVVVEAMAGARVIVSSDLPGIRELTDQLLFPPGDIAGLKAHLQYLLDQPERIPALGASARAAIQRLDLTWSACARNYISEFHYCLSELVR